MSKRHVRDWWQEVLSLWFGFGLVFGVAFGLAVTVLFYAVGHPLWWILAIVEGTGIALGLILPWTESA